MTSTPQVLINAKAIQRFISGHPWIFRSDILQEELSESWQPGDVVHLVSVENKSKQRVLGTAFYNPQSQISLRVLSRSEKMPDTAFWKERISQAICRRGDLKPKTGQRLIHSEADFLPGLIVDRYDDVIVFQTLCAGTARIQELIVQTLQEILKPRATVERNDVHVRQLEGLVEQKGIVSGSLATLPQINDAGVLWDVDVLEGQKTGYYLDQVENHERALKYAKGRTLDLFCYQGGFTMAVADQVDEVISVDSSEPSLEKLKNTALTLGKKNIQTVCANAFDYLHEATQKGEKFDTIIADPPPFIRSRKNLAAGLAGYKEILLRCLKLMKPEGIFIFSSCSQNLTSELLEETLHHAAHDAHRSVQILEKRGAPADHPVLIGFPESEYLHCWIMRVV